jgi:hypothetical protein
LRLPCGNNAPLQPRERERDFFQYGEWRRDRADDVDAAGRERRRGANSPRRDNGP